ncbi:MAG: hypothetical protein JSS83_11290 [Cyanobacteria bacterium SZAS LIN-3]|nr:hypothetical protein [Cyanobacteria bacterium SZAS LIN-3]
MQNSFRLAPGIGQAVFGSNQSRYPFTGIKFMRLIVWKEREIETRLRSKSAFGAQLLQGYALSFIKGVTIDFCARTAQLPRDSARAFAQVMSACHSVDDEELLALDGLLCDHFANPLDPENTIEHAQVGDLNGRNALAIEWTDVYRNCKRISVYIDGGVDGVAVQEIHFAAPLESFDLAKKYFSEVLRSLQWQTCRSQSA